MLFFLAFCLSRARALPRPTLTAFTRRPQWCRVLFAAAIVPSLLSLRHFCSLLYSPALLGRLSAIGPIYLSQAARGAFFSLFVGARCTVCALCNTFSPFSSLGRSCLWLWLFEFTPTLRLVASPLPALLQCDWLTLGQTVTISSGVFPSFPRCAATAVSSFSCPLLAIPPHCVYLSFTGDAVVCRP